MATIQDATRSAIVFARETLGAERTKSLQLEEIESGTEGGIDAWRITLSMPDSDPLNALVAAVGLRREYKTFTVAKATGEVLSMKIREMSRA